MILNKKTIILTCFISFMLFLAGTVAYQYVDRVRQVVAAKNLASTVDYAASIRVLTGGQHSFMQSITPNKSKENQEKSAPPAVTLPPPPIKITLIDGMGVEFSENTPWETIAKMLTLILGTFAGVKCINKYIN